MECVTHKSQYLCCFAGEDSHSSSEDAVQDPNKAWKSLDEGGGLGMAGLAAQLSLPPSNLEFGQSAVSNGQGVWTRGLPLPPGTRFGPFLGKWVLEPENDEFAWEVRIAWISSYFALFEFLHPVISTIDTV